MTKFSEIYEGTTNPPTKEEIVAMTKRLGEVSKHPLWKEFAETVNNEKAWFEDSGGVYMADGFNTFQFSASQLHININPSNVRGRSKSTSVPFFGNAPKDIKELKKVILKNKIDKFVIEMMEKRRARQKRMGEFYKGWKNPD